MDTKGLRRVEVKDADRGEVTAVFATFNTVDSDGDVTLPGAFEDGSPVRISAYQHQSWAGALPVGKGTIRATKDEAVLDGQFFLETAAGRDTFEVVKQMGELQEWSYGYDPAKFSYGEFGDPPRRVRFLEKQTVHEVSPVLLGAGVGTRTLSAKAATKRAVGVHHTDTVTRAWDGPAVVAGIPDDASASDLRSVFAWADPDADATAKSSYKLPHHHGVGGPANVRACLAGIAVLNGGRGGADIPDADREGAYRHLAAHLRDADQEPPELRTGPVSPLKLHDELLLAVAAVDGAIDSVSRVVALRAVKGKPLSQVNTDVLTWVRDDLKRLDELLSPSTSDDEVQREWLRFVAQQKRVTNA